MKKIKIGLAFIAISFSTEIFPQANNGLTQTGAGVVQLGQQCGLVPGDPAQLLGPRVIPMVNNNLFLWGQGVHNSNALGLGYNCTVLPAKLSVLQQNPAAAPFSLAGSFINRDLLNAPMGSAIALSAQSIRLQNVGTNIAGNFIAQRAPVTIGVNAVSAGGITTTLTVGGQFVSSAINPGNTFGVLARTTGPTNNTGLSGTATGGAFSFGVRGDATNATNDNFGAFLNANGGNGSFGASAIGGGATGINAGVRANGNGGTTAFGVDATGNGASGMNHGVAAVGTGGTTTFGVFANGNGATGNNHGVSATGTGGTNSFGVLANANGAATSNVGVSSLANGGQSSFGVSSFATGAINNNIGVTAVANGGISSFGVRTSATGATNINIAVGATANGGITSFGLNANASVADTSYGVFTQANGTLKSYALYARNLGVQPNHWAGYFDGDVSVHGDGWIVNPWSTSDKRFKKDVKQLESTIDKIKKLNGYTYFFRADEFKDWRFSTNEQIGFIAQELKEIFPQLVKEGENGYLGVNYQGMIPVLLEAIKEQQQQIDELKAIAKAPAVNDPSANGNSIAIGNVTLSDAQIIVLEQNVPNPFAESTSIAYNLTDGVTKAQILFYNADGKLVNSVDLKPTAGKGQLNVFASDLSNGIYSYALVVDGKVMDTKRMVKGK